MVNLDTTGGGRVRFNPNLYADGKVCLSLLGTWHGGGMEEKWDAKKSSLYQVLVSIQGLILVDDPMFNEPGFDGIRGTTEGDMKSREHNEEIRLYTVRHAMIAHLKKPRAGVEKVLTEHFRLRKWTVMRKCCRGARRRGIRRCRRGCGVLRGSCRSCWRPFERRETSDVTSDGVNVASRFEKSSRHTEIFSRLEP